MRIAMLSYHTCPLATLGGKDSGGMNVYVHELTRQLGRLGQRIELPPHLLPIQRKVVAGGAEHRIRAQLFAH